MATIHKADTGRISVAEAKRLIIQALPEHEQTDGSGLVDLVMKNGEIVDVNGDTLRPATATETLDMTFLELCRSEGFEPRMKLSPARRGYQLRQSDDELFMVTHAQFQKLAHAYGLTVQIGRAPKQASTGKKWTPEKLAELREFRESHTMPETAFEFGITEQRIRQLLPSKEVVKKGYSAFTHRIK